MADGRLPDGKWLVYRIINREDGRTYIGMTRWKLYIRWSGHKSVAKQGKSRSPLHTAIREYGPQSFAVYVLDECDSRESADEKEREAIKRFKTLDPVCGYNVSIGGGGRSHPYPPFSNSHRANLGAAKSGRKLSPAHRAAISAAQKARKLSEKELANLTFRKGAKHTDESRAKMSRSQMRRNRERFQLLSRDERMARRFSRRW